ncbi:MAG TPA: hypothetical protein VMU25_00015 [Candidatus Paceibacterota bacterium]|nr:hypothetical protein [Candidatus Paceibacterota bacterium]
MTTQVTEQKEEQKLASAMAGLSQILGWIAVAFGGYFVGSAFDNPKLGLGISLLVLGVLAVISTRK